MTDGAPSIVLRCSDCDDPTLTCFFCGKTDCDLQFTIRQQVPSGQRFTNTYGVHDGCRAAPKWHPKPSP